MTCKIITLFEALLIKIQGVPINAVAFLYCIMTTTMSFFPLFNHPPLIYMNWGSVMFGGVAVLCMAYYFIHGRKAYKGPVVDIRYD